MELMSRVERHKVSQSKLPTVLISLGTSVLFLAMIYFMLVYVQIPDSLAFRQTLQISLFFSSILFLGLYLLAFIFVSTKKFNQTEEKVARVNLYIVILWVLSLLYHFILWLAHDTVIIPYYYYGGLALTWGVLLLTLVHFFAYFSFVRRDIRAQAKANDLGNRRHAYEMLKRIFYMYQIIHELMNKDAEVKHMMKWNHFDEKLEQMFLEVEPYIHTLSFNREDLEHILGIKAWMDNLLMIIEQHPLHHDLYKKINM
ncbi:hypothetical protein [Ammoniphilus sp. CFH 90114]|uniref:hypothetical protein n=1 Tax=Ammoniphilus sp. CFH 90114 TaxID=2493665 RepID=UPI00100E834E|nr:hypothetical protein [Ammoniphilus sp. CFH 90114]RXT05848.1 hypothetical protein EIZ39_17250 [Ammoniphilus sp. CFH 90114]